MTSLIGSVDDFSCMVMLWPVSCLEVCEQYDGMKSYQPIFRERESFSSLSGTAITNPTVRLNNSYTSLPSPASPGQTGHHHRYFFQCPVFLTWSLQSYRLRPILLNTFYLVTSMLCNTIVSKGWKSCLDCVWKNVGFVLNSNCDPWMFLSSLWSVTIIPNP